MYRLQYHRNCYLPHRLMHPHHLRYRHHYRRRLNHVCLIRYLQHHPLLRRHLAHPRRQRQRHQMSCRLLNLHYRHYTWYYQPLRLMRRQHQTQYLNRRRRPRHQLVLQCQLSMHSLRNYYKNRYLHQH